MSEDKAREIIAENVAKEVVESIGEDLAGALVEYANLVKELAADLTDEQLEDSSYIKSLLSEQLPNWEWDDWYELLENVRREKYKDAHEEQTAEKIFNDMPYFAKEAAQETLKHLLRAEEAGKLFKLDATADTAAEIMTQVINDFENLLVDERIIIAENECFRFMAKNCIAVYDEMLGVKYSKKKSKFKIDGIIAMLMGLLLCIEENGIEHYNPVEYLDDL